MKIDILAELRGQTDDDLNFYLWSYLCRSIWVNLNTKIPRQEFKIESKI